MRHINYLNFSNIIIAIAFAAFVYAFLLAPVFAGGVNQTGLVQGKSDADAIVIIDQGKGDTRYEASDLSDRNPDAIAPSFGTANQCALGISAAGSFAGIGASFGGHYESDPCNRREDSAMAARLGDAPTGRELMCGDEDYYLANHRARRNPQDPKRCYPNPEFDDRASGSSRTSDAFIMGGNDEAFSSLNALSAD